MSQIYSPQLLALARHGLRKAAFVDAAAAGGAGGDPMAAGAAGPMAPPIPPMPAAGGGDPMAGGGGGGGMMDPAMEARLAAIEAQLAGGGGAGMAGGAGVEPIKPKIDVNVEIMQMKKLLARMADALGVNIPAAEMVATPQDLTQMGMQDQAGGAAPTSAISPPAPIEAASPMAAAGGGGGEGGGEKAASSGVGVTPKDVTPVAKPSSASRVVSMLRRG